MANEMYFSDEELTAHKMAEVYEKSLTTVRIMSLLDDPSLVPGNYDFEHMVEVHKYIFQDFPAAWLEQNEQTKQFFAYLESNILEFEPGLLREEKDPYNPTVKCRELQADSKTIGSMTHYSCMALSDVEYAEKVLLENHPSQLKNLSKDEVVDRLATVYQDLDFVHPFEEGNSRTLRTMTQLMAQEAGHELSWANINQNDLYAARDLSLNQKTIAYYGEMDEEFEFVDEARVNLQRLQSYDFPPLSQLLQNGNQPALSQDVTQRNILDALGPQI